MRIYPNCIGVGPLILRISGSTPILVLIVLLSIPMSLFAAQISSPDTRITVNVDTDSDGRPVYSIRYRGREIVGESKLGLRFAANTRRWIPAFAYCPDRTQRQ